MKIKNNLISGSFASLSGVLTKVGFSFGKDGAIDARILPLIKENVPSVNENIEMLLKYGLHGVFMVMAVTVSGLMYTYYLRSMHENGAAKATVYNFAVNYVGSIIFGALIFDEKVTVRLLGGVFLILLGTSLISTC